MPDLPRAESLESSMLALDDRRAQVLADAIEHGRAVVDAIAARHDAELGDDPRDAAAAAFDADVLEAQRSALMAYATRSDAAFAPTECEEWRTAVAHAPASTTRAMLLELGVPGAATLLTALDPVPPAPQPAITFDADLARIARHCTCGYATRRIVPAETCPHCQLAIAGAWSAEERRLLARAPELAAAQAAVVEPLLDELADLAAKVRSDAARRRIERIVRAHASRIEALGIDRWLELADLAARDTRPRFRAAARRAPRTGLGAARLAAIELHGSDEVKARIGQRTLDGPIGSTRPKPFAWMRRLLGRDD